MYIPRSKIHNRVFDWGARTYVMGILNITPDSFSGDGMLSSTDSNGKVSLHKILVRAREFAASGVDIIDIGGESTRPGAEQIGPEDEMERVLPAIRLLSSELDVLISIDTYKAKVAEAGIQAGAHIVNDVWSLHADPELAKVIAINNVPVILMHNRSSWAHAQVKERLGGRYVSVPYDDLMSDVKRELLESVSLAHEAGIPDDHIILDPGIGFGKTVEQNLELIDRLEEIRMLGYPVLFGPSRKSFIGYTLDLSPDQRLEGTAAAAAVGIARGGDILRVHDVNFMSRVARMTDAIVRRV